MTTRARVVTICSIIYIHIQFATAEQNLLPFPRKTKQRMDEKISWQVMSNNNFPKFFTQSCQNIDVS